ncbi:MAG: hypothetical protein J6Y74_03820 [Clostridia bacterium]|nr:hypothetical protein [Clostridia bacterium]
MILEECAVFAKMLAAGLAAGVFARFLHLLGSASSSARIFCDALIAAETGAAYFLSLYFSAGGVFRLYSLAAFSFGVFLSISLLLRFSPLLRRLAARAISPLLKGYRKVETSLEKRLRPLLEKREARRRKRRGKRAETRAKREEARLRKKKISLEKRSAKSGSRRVEIEH